MKKREFRTKSILVLLTPFEHARLTRDAARLGIPIAVFIRSRVFGTDGITTVLKKPPSGGGKKVEQARGAA